MTTNEKKLLTRIGEKALQHDWEIAFNGKSKGNHHLERVQKIAEFLQKHEGGNDFIVQAAAWVHDVSLSVGNDDKPSVILGETRSFLKQFPLALAQIETIATAASGHEGDISAATIEAKIVHDADAVDKAGTLGIIRHIWKMTNLIKNRVLSDKTDLVELQEHLRQREQRIYTSHGSKLIKKLNSDQEAFFHSPDALALTTIISKLAMDGIISDKIAEKLIHENVPFSKILQAQLTCEYLSDTQ